jgi:hypothetical protein
MHPSNTDKNNTRKTKKKIRTQNYVEKGITL